MNDALEWTKDIVKASTKLTAKDFEAMKLFDRPYLMTARAAAEHGIVSAVVEAAVPAGSQPRVVM